jgi:3-oxoacyl-[acyl-carrier-protein] synthase II
MAKKIVITGVGASSPLGGTAPESWAALLAGESGVRTLPHDWVEQYDLPVHFAGEARVRPEEVLERPVAKRLDPSSQFALVAALEALADAGNPEVAPERLVMPLTVPMLMPNAPSAAVSMHLGARAYARTVASACASSTESLVNAYEHLQLGLADVVIAGGSESAIHPITVAAFSSMQALSKRNDSPETASRPYAVDRDGFVMGEGGAALVVETEEHALARGARIYAELAGGGVTSDSYHITAPEPEGRGASRAVELALQAAGASPDEVTHINAHATSTPTGDGAEYNALRVVFGDRVDGIPVSATKAATGHLLGGTGALEAVFTVLALRDRLAPPTINVAEQDPEIPLTISARPMPLGDGPQLALSNSFGFGGHNAVVAIRSYD